MTKPQEPSKIDENSEYDQDIATDLFRHTDIVSVFLVNGNTKRPLSSIDGSSREKEKKHNIGFTMGGKVDYGREGTSITKARAQIRFTAAEFGDDNLPLDESVFVVRANFEVLLRVKEDTWISEETDKFIIDICAKMYVWPYWREYFRDSLSRMGLTPMHLPPEPVDLF